MLDAGDRLLHVSKKPKIISKLRDGTFTKTFLEKGRLSGLMEAIPIRVILNPKTALYGAAHCAALI